MASPAAMPAGAAPDGPAAPRDRAVVQFLLRYGIVLALLALGAVFAWRSPVS